MSLKVIIIDISYRFHEQIGCKVLNLGLDGFSPALHIGRHLNPLDFTIYRFHASLSLVGYVLLIVHVSETAFTFLLRDLLSYPRNPLLLFILIIDDGTHV
jgi:hypothetical protein